MANDTHKLSRAWKLLALITVIHCCHTATVLGQKCGALDNNLRKSALIIGINRYELLPDLHNPVNDAIDLAAALKRLHFNTKLDTNQDLKTLNINIQAWLNNLDTCDVAILYFAGHGGQLDNENYLMPSNGNTTSPSTVKRSGLRISELVNSMKAQNHKLNIIIADACRNNPVMGQKNSFLSGGFGKMESPGKGTMICFATGVGKTVDDLPNQRNSKYTNALLKYIELSNIPISTIFNKVYDEITDDTSSKQDPWVDESVGSSFDHCLLVTDEIDLNIDSTDAVMAQKYRAQNIAPSEQRAAYFKRKMDTLMGIMQATRTEVIAQLGDDLQPNQSGSGPDYTTLSYSFTLAIENIYSRTNAIWLKIDVFTIGNTLNFTFSGDNKSYINSNKEKDILSMTEHELNLPDTLHFGVSLYITDWKKVKQNIKHYYVERAAALKPKYLENGKLP